MTAVLFYLIPIAYTMWVKVKVFYLFLCYIST